MTGISTREEQLLRMIGEERGEHPPELVGAAELELARRAGGTRRQARGRIRTAGALVALVGILIGGAGFGVYEAVVVIFGPSGGIQDATVTVGVIGFLGLAVVALGVAVGLRVGWVLRCSPLIPFLQAADVEAAAYKPDTAELLHIIGAGRAGWPPEAVGAAERQLGQRLQTGRNYRLARVKSWGGLAALLGLLMMVNSAVFGFLILLLQAVEEMVPQFAGLLPVSGADAAVTWAGVFVHAVVGAVLLVGGLGLRALTHWGRVAVLWALWASLAAAVLISIAALPRTLTGAGLTVGTALSVGGTVLADAAWLAVCWWAARVLARPEVREACGEDVSSG